MPRPTCSTPPVSPSRALSRVALAVLALALTAACGGGAGGGTPAALQSVSVGPGAASVAKGLTQAFAATGYYSDGTTRDLTAVATWTSSNSAVATVSAAGLATGAGLGVATIAAAYGGQSGQATLSVTAAALQSISVSPGAAPVAKGLAQAFAATGHYSDGTTQDLTAVASWTSSDSAVATVSASGVATGSGVGVATIAAAYGGQSGQATLIVTAAALQSISVSPGAASVAAGLTQAFAATGHYSDGTTQDLTALALWASADPGVATVSALGVATGVVAGTTSISAAYGGQVGSATLQVTAPSLQAIAVAPPSASVAAGLTQPFTATGRYSDGSTQDLTAVAAWTSSDPAVATVSAAGLATGLKPGQVLIAAAYGGRSGDAVLVVDAPALVSVAVAPSSASVAAGLTTAFAATGTYSDGSTQDVTLLAAWSSSDVSVATVSSGLATGRVVGQVTIDALYGGQLGTASLQVTAPVLQSLAVSPGGVSIAKGLTQAFAATGSYSDGTTQDLTATATWTSSDAAVATLSPSGVASAVGTGSALVTATVGGVAGQASLVVTPAALQSVSVSPGTASVAMGLTQAFAATGHYTDGTTQDLTSTATWTSSNPAVASVSSSGLATGTGPGSAAIAAAFGGQSGQATLTVTAAIVQSVTLWPASASVPSGLTQAFTATAHWSDGSTSDVTATASWTTLDPTVATATGNAVKGVSVGSTQVRATAQGVTGSAALSVTAAVVQAVTISPADATLAAGTQLQYSAQALYSDGSKQDVTASASWASSNAAAATVAGGLATGVSPGPTTISATFSSVAGTTPLTVTPATLTSISISPSAPSVPAGLSQPFTATGIFSDGTREDLTSQVTWTSSAPGVATISASGVATAVAVGTATIGAARGGVSTSTTLTVTGATLTALTVVPPTATIAKGTTVACSVTGTYSDGTTQDLTAAATWTSSGPAVTVSNAPGSQGLATGEAVGAANAIASYGGLSDFSAVTVTGAVLQAIAITPSGATVPAGTTQALLATGTFSDGTTQDLTALASWTSSDGAVAEVSNASGTSGVVTAIAPGSVTIAAAFSGLSATAPLTVSSAVLVSIQVSPADARLPAGYTLQYRAVGTYSDASMRDLTDLATWTSSNAAVATISNATGSQGLATGVAASATPVQIGANLGGTSGSTSLTVTSIKLSSIAVTPSPFSVLVGASLQFTAMGTFQDGTVLNVTNQVGWSTSPHGVATISRGGLLTGVNAGSLTVTAKKTGKTGTVNGTVN